SASSADQTQLPARKQLAGHARSRKRNSFAIFLHPCCVLNLGGPEAEPGSEGCWGPGLLRAGGTRTRREGALVRVVRDPAGATQAVSGKVLARTDNTDTRPGSS